MAAIEEAEHGAQSGRTREWFARAARAPRDPIWIADGVASETWEPVSPLTGQLDAFVWQAPPSAIGVSPEPEPAEPLETPALVPARAQAAPNPMGLKPVEIAAGAPVPAEPKLVGVKPADLKPVTAGATAKGDTSAPDPVSAGMAAAALRSRRAPWRSARRPARQHRGR